MRIVVLCTLFLALVVVHVATENVPAVSIAAIHSSAHSATQKQHASVVIVPHNVSKASNASLATNEEPMDSGYAILVFYSFMFLMLGAQTGLFMWKKKHKRSYDAITLFGLWLVPAAFSAQLHFWIFVTVWFFYSVVTGFLLYKCTKKKMMSTTPRLVYAWFLATHRISVFVGAVGYFVLLLDMLGLGQLLFPRSFAITALWYGIYFGCLGRDTAEVASDQMASSMAYGRSLTATINNCGICRNEMKDFSHMGEEVSSEEKVVQLSCKHCFHDLCIRGWTMVGKKDICPVCNEKVDLRNLYSDRPWETGNLSWIQMLDMFRYLVVWMPVIFIGFSVVVHVLGLAGHHTPHPDMGHVPNGTAMGATHAHTVAHANLHNQQHIHHRHAQHGHVVHAR